MIDNQAKIDGSFFIKSKHVRADIDGSDIYIYIYIYILFKNKRFY
jgi:hypothetical protein